MSIGSDNKATTNKDFDNLSTQIAKVNPTGPNFASYTPSNSPQACPTTSTWQAATALPPTPNEAICSCMMSSLKCAAKSSLSDTDVAKQFAYICSPTVGGVNNCEGILANGTTGAYGAYSMCNGTERLSWAYNQYYLNQTSTNTQNNQACDFSGTAQTQSAKAASSCASITSQAGAQGTGTVTNAPAATDISGSGNGNGGSSGTSSTSKAAAIVLTVPALDFGILKLAAYVTSAMLVGVGMVLL